MTNYKGTYFLKNEKRNGHEWSNSENILVNTENSRQLKEEILRLISSAKKCLKICSFIINDEEVFEALKQKLVQEDTVLFILTSLDPRKLSSNYFTEEERSDESIKMHQRIISTLYNLGGHVRTADNIHAKFIISDSSKALVMSANLTSFSLNLNPESGIYFSSQEDLKSIEILFEKIFLKATTIISFRKKGKGRSSIESLHKSIKSSDLNSLDQNNLVYTYEGLNNSIYQKLISIIDDANSYISIGTYSIVELENLPELLESLRKAKERKVDIKFFCRAMNHRPDHLEGCKKLLELGISVYGDLYNHAKGIISEKGGMIFTANIDGKHGLKSGFEVGLILKGKYLSSLREFLNWQIDSAFFAAGHNPAIGDLHISESYKENLKNISAIEIGETITIDTNSIEIKSELKKYPVYLLCSRKKVNGIKVKNKTFAVTCKGSKILIKEEKKLYNRAQYMIKHKKLNII